jgi:hypothetical protein
MKQIEKLTKEAESFIELIRQKWRKIALDTGPLNRKKADLAVKEAYRALGWREPEIIFLNSPHGLEEIIKQKSPEELATQLGAPLLLSLPAQLSEQLQAQLHEDLWQRLQRELPNEQLPHYMFIWQDFIAQHGELLALLWAQWQNAIFKQIWEQQEERWREQLLKLPVPDPLTQIEEFLWTKLGEPLSPQLEESFVELAERTKVRDWDEQIRQPFFHAVGAVGLMSNIGRNMLASSVPTIDFCISVLNCNYDVRQWEALQGLVRECGLVVQLENICLVCDRPQVLRFNSRHRLHAEGTPAIEYADGYGIYVYEGVRLPKEYELPLEQWQSNWLLQEKNADLRRVLIQGIGYDRLCQELQAVELDAWREYSLIRIDSQVDVEPIYLLKMICPSTASIHAARVPPEITTAREAIRWVNWDTDPEDFSAES